MFDVIGVSISQNQSLKDSLLLCEGSAKCLVRASIGPSPLTAAWETNPTKAIIARRPFLTSFNEVRSLFMLRGSNGYEFRKPDCMKGTRQRIRRNSLHMSPSI